MFQSDSVAFVASGDGVFIPPSNLGGFLAAEMANAEPLATRLGKFFYAFGKQLASFRLNNPDVVGFNSTRSEVVVEDRFGVKQKVFNFQFQQVTDDRTGLIQFPPAATSGIRAGLADFAFTDVFPNAVKVAAGATTSGAGVLILSSAIDLESTLNHASINLGGDCREYVRALLSAAFTNRPLRTAETASAVVAASYGSSSVGAIPATWTQALNPFTNLAASDTRFMSVLNRTISFTIETIENEDTQTFDVNSIVTPA